MRVRVFLVRECVYLRACMRTCVCVSVRAFVFVYVYVCVSVRVCARACV